MIKIAKYEKNVNTRIFNEFIYQNVSLLVKDLYNANKIIDEKVVSNVSDALIDLRKAVNKKIAENENLDKVTDVVGKIT